MIGYSDLQDVLNEALAQARCGKGQERHGSGLAFHEQPILAIPKIQDSMDGLVFQACKKGLEAKRILELYGPEKAIQELYGSIIYLSAACLWLKGKQ